MNGPQSQNLGEISIYTNKLECKSFLNQSRLLNKTFHQAAAFAFFNCWLVEMWILSLKGACNDNVKFYFQVFPNTNITFTLNNYMPRFKNSKYELKCMMSDL